MQLSGVHFNALCRTSRKERQKIIIHKNGFFIRKMRCRPLKKLERKKERRNKKNK